MQLQSTTKFRARQEGTGPSILAVLVCSFPIELLQLLAAAALSFSCLLFTSGYYGYPISEVKKNLKNSFFYNTQHTHAS
jgi:hypothetical protein